MKKQHLKVLVPGLFAAAALALAVGVGAQTPPPAPPAPAAKSPQAAPMTGHHRDAAAMAAHDAAMKAEHEAMMAKKQEMQGKLQAMDAALDKLVAEMNAAKESKEPDALEKPMAAVINELVAQRKAFISMMMEHMGQHPMMKKSTPPEPKAEEKKP